MAFTSATGGLDSPGRFARWWAGMWGRRLLVEMAIIGGLFLLYKQVRTLVRDEQIEAMRNAARVVRWERAVGLFSEIHLQNLVLNSRTVVEVLNQYYVSVHFPLTLAVVVWAYCRHRATTYSSMKFLLISVTAVSLCIHVLFPLAPPRMLGHLGFVDTLREFGPHIYPDDPRRSVANQFAAMPSLHFGWSVIVAWAIATTVKRPWGHLAWIHPVMTLVAITATANHYWLDSLVVLVLVALAMGAWSVVRPVLELSDSGTLARAVP
jgi:hypothetical protein